MEIDYIEFIMAHKIPLMIVYGCLFLMAFIGNLLVIIVMCKDKTLKETSANCFIISIAAADLISGTFVIPLSIYGIIITEDYKTCSWVASSMLIMYTITINLQLASSIDRYYAVGEPLKYFARKDSGSKKWSILGSVVLGTFLGIWPALGWNSGEMRYPHGCLVMDVLAWSYTLFLSSLTLLSAIVVIIIHILIYKSIRKQTRNRSSLFANRPNRLDQDKALQREHKEIRITKTLSLIVGSFMICWTPGALKFFAISVTGNPYFMYDYFGIHYGILFCSFAFTASCMNSAIDPLIYAWRMKEIRAVIFNMFIKKSDIASPVHSMNGHPLTRASTKSSIFMAM